MACQPYVHPLAGDVPAQRTMLLDESAKLVALFFDRRLGTGTARARCDMADGCRVASTRMAGARGLERQHGGIHCG